MPSQDGLRSDLGALGVVPPPVACSVLEECEVCVTFEMKGWKMQKRRDVASASRGAAPIAQRLTAVSMSADLLQRQHWCERVNWVGSAGACCLAVCHSGGRMLPVE